MRTAETTRILLAILLGLTAAGANGPGGLLIAGGQWARAGVKYFFVLVGSFLVHFFEHTLAPHFHFGEETHHEQMSHAHASYAALLGLMIHTFFDGVAIASGLLVSTWLGGVIFVAVFLHKLPEGFTVASLM